MNNLPQYTQENYAREKMKIVKELIILSANNVKREPPHNDKHEKGS